MKAEAKPREAIAAEELPPGWRMATIGELLKVRNGFAFKSVDYQEEGALLIRQSNLDGSRVTVENAKYLPKPYLEEFRDYLIRKGDILIGMSGSIGKLCTYDRDEPALQNQRTGLLVFKDPEQKPWVWHYLPLLEKELVKVGKGVAVQNVSASQIESFPIPVAPHDQQKRIVAEIEKQFSRLDEAVANLKRVKANLKRYKAAVLKATVEGHLVETEAELARREGRSYETGEQLLQRILEARRSQWQGKGKYKEPAAPDTTDLPELPEGWVWASADQISEFITKGTTPSAVKMTEGNGEVQFLKVYNLTFEGKLNYRCKPAFISRETHEVELARSKVRAGDVLINIVGPPLGQVALVPPEVLEANINQAIARFRPVEPLMVGYLVQTLLTEQVMGWAIRRAKTTAGQANLTLQLCRELPVPLPPLAEQQSVASDVDRRLSLADKAEAQVDANLQRAERLRQSILFNVFTGNM